MVEPRLPEPMTPLRADLLARRWRLASLAAFVIGLALVVSGVAYALPLAVVVQVVLLVPQARHLGWLNGYRVARTEDLRRDAGELL